jgi:autotransporter-associated beta strand protein
MTNFLLSRCLLKNRSVLAASRMYVLLIVGMLMAGANTKAQQYWNTNGTLANITASNWGPLGGPYSTAYNNGIDIVFTANSNISYTSLIIVRNVTVTNGSTVTWTPTGTYSTGGAIRTFDIGAGSILNWNGTQAVSIAGSGFNKIGTGTWRQGTQNNNYSGGFTISAGTFLFAGNSPFGSGTINFNGGVVANYSGSLRTINNSAINIGGNFQLGDASGTSNISFVGNINLGAATRTITIGSAAVDTLRGNISGGAGAGLTIASISTGRIVLGSSGNTYSGATTINSGLLYAGIANSLPATTALVLANTAGAQYLLNNFNTTVGSIAGGGGTGGNIVLGTGGLTTGGANSSTSYGGVISGTGTFTKNGTGTQTLTGANTYTGSTTVNAGGLLVNGSTASGSSVAVSGGATLGGSGTVAGTVALSGTVSPAGAALTTGTLNTGAIGFAANSTYLCEVSNVAGTQGAASGWDFLNSSGAITVSSSPININLNGLAGNGFNNNSSYTWVIATGASIVGFNAANFTITPSGFSATGTFSIEQSGNSLQIVYTPPSGNTITLSPLAQLSGASYCNGIANNTITLTYVTSGTVTAPAIELSDATGSFASGTVQLPGTITPGSPNTITGTVPSAQTPGTLYRVRIISSDAIPVISGNNGNNITITNAVTPSVSIAITTGANPSCTGSSITFTATPTNGGTPGYQWKRNGVNIGGATSVTYTSTTLVSGDIITCEMTSSLACITAASALSNDITMTVNPLPSNPPNPVAAGANPSCGSNSLNTMAPDPNTTFYWQGTVLNGQSTANPTTSAYTASASGTYYVTSQSTDGCWSAGSGSIAITVNTAASISVQPVDRNISSGANTTFSVTASNATGFQWQVDQGSGFTDVTNGGVYAGATTATLTLTGVPVGFNGYQYRCVIKAGACADLPSAAALLGVNPVPWEDFETGTKAAYATAPPVTCTAGSWLFDNALIATTPATDFIAGNKSARLTVNGILAMNFNLTSLGLVRLSHRLYAGDLNSTWRLEASTNNGSTWSAFTSSVFTSTSTVQTENILVNIAGNIRFRFVNLETSGNHRINIDDIYVTTYSGCTTPTAQATFVNVTGITSNSMTVNFGAGAGGVGRIVVMKQGSPVSGFPTSGVAYTPGSSDFSTALPTIAANEKVVYSGTGTSVNVTGLTPNATYYMQVFEFAASNCYLISTVSNIGSATTACNTPVTNASGVAASAVTTTTATLSWTNGSGTNRLVVVNAVSAVTGSPVNGNSYSANASYSAAPAFTPGTGRIVYNSTSNTVALTNLASNTVYHVAVFEFNSATNCYVSTGAVTSFATGSQISDIISADGESSCISSIINGNITTVTDGVQAWQLDVRDGGGAAPDADALPTIINSIQITQGSGNTVADWTNLQSAALFDGSTLISTGVITGTTITFTGAPLVNIADNSSKILSLRISLKAITTIPATIDGRVFRFSISQANITMAGSGTSGKNTSAPVATTDITKDVVCVVATKLVFTVQPTNTGQNEAMSPNVVVTAYDANNNIDLNFTQSVTLTSNAGAGLQGTPLTATAIAGSATFTGIKHTTTGSYTMTAASSGFTNVNSAVYIISPVTTFAPGDFAILAVNNNNTNNVDEIAFVVFKEVITGTSFYMTDNGYERANAGKWGTSEGIVRLTYTGASSVPAGTVFVVQGNNTSFTMLKCGVNDNANWSINTNVLTAGNFNLNSNDQVWFSQAGTWTSASGSLTGQDAVTDGKILYGWTGINWKPNIGNTAPTWTTQGSRLYPQMGCFSTNLNLASDLGKYKYTGPTTATSRLGWITRINDITNWTTYLSNATYDAAAVNYAGGTGSPCVFTINPGAPVDGKWTGSKNTDWFDCNNWDTREVPDATMSVTVDNTASNACVVDNVTNAANAIQYGNAANCFNLTVTGGGNGSLSTGNALDTINVNGNFVLSGGSVLNMTGGGFFNLQTGSWTKTASTFTSGTGTVSYNSTTNQNIAVEDYFNLTSTSSGTRVLPASPVGILGAFTPGTNAYTITGSTVDFKGTNQNIPAFVFNNLTLSNSGTKTLAGNADVEADLNIINTVNLSLANSYLNLKSSATKTARVAPVSASATISYPGTGRFVVERYFPGKRSWRLITAPVTVDAGKTFFNSWQAGGNNGLSNENNGTYITGPGETAANGLDVSPQHNYSLKSFNQLTSNFDGIGDTKGASRLISGTAGAATVPDNVGYFMFVRGDRTVNNPQPFNTAVIGNATTLRDTGRIQVQNYTFNCNPSSGTHKYTLIGNPYASPVDFAALSRNNVANRFWAWDPSLNGSNGVGAYVIVDLSGPSITTVPAGEEAFTTQTQIIQSTQAFLVETTGASPTLAFEETDKSAVNNLNLFRPTAAPVPSLIANLYIVGADGSKSLADGVLAQFGNEFASGRDQMDAVKFSNVNETFSIKSGADYFMLERRPYANASDTIFFSFNRARQLRYRFNIILDNIIKQRNRVAYLEDRYLQTSTALDMKGSTWFDFEVNSNAGSAAANRFYIVFKKLVKFNTIKAAAVAADVVVNWAVDNAAIVDRYQVERSADGINFTPIGETLAIKDRTASAAYSFTDLNPAPGIYYYRVKAVSDAYKGYEQTDAVKVKLAKYKGELYVFPNPVSNNAIGLQMNLTMPEGVYAIRLMNSNGQAVMTKQIQHSKNTATETISYPAYITDGTYQLEVTSPDKKRSVITIVIVKQ